MSGFGLEKSSMGQKSPSNQDKFQTNKLLVWKSIATFNLRGKLLLFINLRLVHFNPVVLSFSRGQGIVQNNDWCYKTSKRCHKNYNQ